MLVLCTTKTHPKFDLMLCISFARCGVLFAARWRCLVVVSGLADAERRTAHRMSRLRAHLIQDHQKVHFMIIIERDDLANRMLLQTC